MTENLELTAIETQDTAPEAEQEAETITPESSAEVITEIDTEETAQETEQEAEPITSESITEVITELEEYRERLVKDMTTVAKKAKLPKSKLEEQLKPELTKIETALQGLRTQHAAMTENNNNNE